MKRVIIVAALTLFALSCKKKENTKCWTCVNTHDVYLWFGMPIYRTWSDSVAKCGVDSVYIYSYEQSQASSKVSDSVYSNHTKCHL